MRPTLLLPVLLGAIGSTLGAAAADDTSSIPDSPSISAIQDAIAGRPRFSESEASAVPGSETPRVNGYAFV